MKYIIKCPLIISIVIVAYILHIIINVILFFFNFKKTHLMFFDKESREYFSKMFLSLKKAIL